LKDILDQGTESGIFEESEQDMVERIFRLNDRNVSAFMTPRTETVFLDIDATHEEIQHIINKFPFSRFPVIKDSIDNLIGIVQSRDLLLQRLKAINMIFNQSCRNRFSYRNPHRAGCDPDFQEYRSRISCHYRRVWRCFRLGQLK
jgi:CBS domain containing-hemolysin-like protein